MAIQDFEKPFYRMSVVSVADGQGGYTKTWSQSVSTVQIAMACNQSLEALKAMAQGVRSVYTLNFDSGIALAYNEYIKRASDGAIFRITSDPADNETPSVTTLDRRTATAERTELPNP